jgi:asparaginyl-tRNA synthetase
MIEPEMAFYDNNDNMGLIERFIKFVIGRVLYRCREELTVLERNLDSLQKVVDNPFHRVAYDDAVKILRGELEINKCNAIQIQKDDMAAFEARIKEIEEDVAARQKAIAAGMKKGARKFNEAKILSLQSEQYTTGLQKSNLST